MSTQLTTFLRPSIIPLLVSGNHFLVQIQTSLNLCCWLFWFCPGVARSCPGLTPECDSSSAPQSVQNVSYRVSILPHPLPPHPLNLHKSDQHNLHLPSQVPNQGIELPGEIKMRKDLLAKVQRGLLKKYFTDLQCLNFTHLVRKIQFESKFFYFASYGVILQHECT